MIISKFVTIYPRNNCKRWSQILGYHVNYSDVIEVPIHLVPKNSNKEVEAVCDDCGVPFKRSLQLLNKVDKHRCFECSRKQANKANSDTQAGKPRPWQIGEGHSRWKGNRKEFDVYAGRVHALTRSPKLKKIWMTWDNADKIGRCGVEGAYQLDHKVSIAYGFYNHIPAEIIGQLSNLEIITWESNRAKSKSSSIDLWDLLS